MLELITFKTSYISIKSTKRMKSYGFFFQNHFPQITKKCPSAVPEQGGLLGNQRYYFKSITQPDSEQFRSENPHEITWKMIPKFRVHNLTPLKFLKILRCEVMNSEFWNIFQVSIRGFSGQIPVGIVPSPVGYLGYLKTVKKFGFGDNSLWFSNKSVITVLL
jgi:hypothetical protein